MRATQSIMFYSAEVWTDTLEKQVHHNRFAQVQRRARGTFLLHYLRPSRGGDGGSDPLCLLAKERDAI